MKTMSGLLDFFTTHSCFHHMVCNFSIVDTIYGGVNRLSGACVFVSDVTFERGAHIAPIQEDLMRR